MENYFHFTRPVSGPERFAGRKSELETVRYYLDQPTSTNLMLVGPRGIGKTSLLNVAQTFAADRGYYVLRCDLDERMMSDEATLFVEIFESLADTVRSEAPHFVELPDWSMPQFGAGADHGRLYTTDHSIRRSLQALTEALGINEERRLIILLDEGDNFSLIMALKQRFRNTMLQIPAVQVILTSVGDLLDPEPQAYSPFARSFTAIRLQAYRSIEDTAECIQLPLRLGGFHGEIPESFIERLHDITNGHPYLIHLVCHTWLRHNRASEGVEFTLDPETLDDLRRLAYDLPYPEIGAFWKRIRDAKIPERDPGSTERKPSKNWQEIGSWDADEWQISEPSKGLQKWMEHLLRENPDVWAETAARTVPIITRGNHFNYRISPREDGA